MAGSTISDDFAARKRKILAQLAVPDAEYTDASPKGTVDAGIRDLIDELNGLDGFVTTSSCGGRVSVFVEGVKKKGAAAQNQAQEAEDTSKATGEEVDKCNDAEAETAARPAGMTLAAAGGKGGGGNWLFVSHDPVPNTGDQTNLEDVLGLKNVCEEVNDEGSSSKEESSSRLIHFKFEPMVSKHPNHPGDGELQCVREHLQLFKFMSSWKHHCVHYTCHVDAIPFLDATFCWGIC